MKQSYTCKREINKKGPKEGTHLVHHRIEEKVLDEFSQCGDREMTRETNCEICGMSLLLYVESDDEICYQEIPKSFLTV